MHTFSERLSRELERHNFTQVALAQRLSVPQGTVSRWLKGTSPHRKTVIQLAKVLGVRPEWLLTGEEPKLPEGKAEQEIQNLPIPGANAVADEPPPAQRSGTPQPSRDATIAKELRLIAASLERLADYINPEKP